MNWKRHSKATQKFSERFYLHAKNSTSTYSLPSSKHVEGNSILWTWTWMLISWKRYEGFRVYYCLAVDENLIEHCAPRFELLPYCIVDWIIQQCVTASRVYRDQSVVHYHDCELWTGGATAYMLLRILSPMAETKSLSYTHWAILIIHFHIMALDAWWENSEVRWRTRGVSISVCISVVLGGTKSA